RLRRRLGRRVKELYAGSVALGATTVLGLRGGLGRGLDRLRHLAGARVGALQLGAVSKLEGPARHERESQPGGRSQQDASHGFLLLIRVFSVQRFFILCYTLTTTHDATEIAHRQPLVTI